MNYSYFDEAFIHFAEPAPLMEGFESIASREDLSVTPGRPVAAMQAEPLLKDNVRVPGENLAQYTRQLSLTLPEGEQLKKGFYVLLRRVHGYD